jgi:hypothetical protein
MKELIQRLEKGEEFLSFTSITEFAISPSHFIAYKLKEEKKETKAMKRGNFVHKAILLPKDFETEYCALLKSMIPNPEANFTNSANKKFKDAFEAECIANGKTMLTPAEYDLAIQMRDLANNNEISGPILKSLTQREYAAEWEFCGFKWHGFIDGLNPDLILELKTIGDVRPKKVKWESDDNKWHWQHALYGIANQVNNHVTICLDEKGGIAVYKFSPFKIQLAIAELTALINSFKMCLENNLWHQNYEFWTDSNNGCYTID